MVSFSKVSSNVVEELEDQVAYLTKELSSLRKQMSKRGARAYSSTSDTAADLYAELWERISDSLPVIRKRARYAETLARDNPATTAAIGLAVVGLAALFFARR